MDQPTTKPEQAPNPRFVRSAELLGQEVEIIFVDEVESEYGPEYLFDLRLSGGEIVSFTRRREPWRSRGVEMMRAQAARDEPVLATLVQPGRALLWSPFDMRGGSKFAAARADRLRAFGYSAAPDETGE